MYKFAFIMFGLLLALALYSGSASAAVTGCVDVGAGGAYYTYNDTGNVTNVTAGRVCIYETNYDVNASAAGSCSATWANYTDGACQYTRFYVGFAGDGTDTCVATDWQVETAAVFIAADYIINTTTDAEISGDYVWNTGETATYDACLNTYTRQGPDGYCDGAGVLDTDDATTYVLIGRVCIAGANENPNASVNCGTWSNCVEDASTAPEYYVGYTSDGSGACTATNWQTAGTTYTTNPGQFISTTEDVDTCSVKGYAYTYAKGDLQLIVEDGIGTAGAETVSWLDLIVLLLVLGFMIGIVLKFKGIFQIGECYGEKAQLGSTNASR